MGDDLGEQRVVARADLVAGLDPRIDADARPGRPAQLQHTTGPGQEAGVGVLGVQANLDRVAAQHEVALADAERRSGGDLELAARDVDRGHGLGDRMLDLDPRVHLEEGVAAVGLEQELGGAGADVSDLGRKAQGGGAQLGAQLLADPGGGRLLEHLLVTPLDRAVALSQMHGPAVRVGDDLDLDVARLLDVALVEQRVVAERGLRLARGRRDRLVQIGGIAHDPHPAAPATRRCLDQQRIGQPVAAPSALHDRHAGPFCQLSRRVLAREPHECAGRRPHEADALARAGLRELGGFAEESVAGVQRVAAGLARGRGEQVRIEVRGDLVGRVGDAHVHGAGVGGLVERHAAAAHLAAGACETHGDLAAAGERHRRELRRHAGHTGRRRSRNARSPSCPSAEARRSAIASAVRRRSATGSWPATA